MTHVLLTLAFLSMASGDGAQPPDRKTQGVDACALVTRAEATALLEGLRGEPEPRVGLQQERECLWISERGAQLLVSVSSSERWDFQKGIVSEMNPQPIAGLGDEAFSVRRGSDSEVYVRKGALMLEVRGSAGMEASRGMAEKAAGRL